MAKNTFLDWDTTAGNNQDVGGIGILGTNAVNNFDDALRTIMAQLRAGVDGEVVYATKSGNYTALANDNNAVHIYTATATVSLTAAATLAANWHYTVVANGAAVTIDPNASETINGLATLSVPDGATAEIICDGSNFFTFIRPSAFVTIGVVPFTGQSAIDWTDLGSYRHLQLIIEGSVSSNASLSLRVSTNNGSSYLAGATDYSCAVLAQSGATVTGVAIANNPSMYLMSTLADSGSQYTSTVDLTNFNKNLLCSYRADTTYATSAVYRREFPYGFTTAASARNALRLFPSAGAFTSGSGQATLRGIRG